VKAPIEQDPLADVLRRLHLLLRVVRSLELVFGDPLDHLASDGRLEQ